jgi:glycosyltransferase involved in cell wall biosynthesis
VSERIIDLSILMPVYDERATVERAIEAELGASYELIVLDDGSRVVATLVRCRLVS